MEINSKEWQEAFAARLRLFRTKAGMSLKELSAASDISVYKLKRFEEGLSDPYLAEVIRVSKVYKCPIEDFDPNRPVTVHGD